MAGKINVESSQIPVNIATIVCKIPGKYLIAYPRIKRINK